MKNEILKKLIVIVGPTASGKSDLAVRLALKFNGEVVSADSRQVYRGMDIGSGKITRIEQQGIRHHLLDVASPKRTFTVAQYQKMALKAIDRIQRSGKVPIVCGGTGFYVRSVTELTLIPAVAPDWKLREKLEKISIPELFKMLDNRDPATAMRIERSNPRRLIRALEIVIKTGKPVPKSVPTPLPYPILKIGININREKLNRLIARRLNKRLRRGMVAEIKKLRSGGLSWKRLESFGLEYRYAALFLQKKITRGEMISRIQTESQQYVKRQLTWFKKDKQIKWIKNWAEAKKLAAIYLLR